MASVARSWLLSLAGIAALLGGCSPRGDEPAVIRVGVLPDRARSDLVERYEPLVDHLASWTGLELELIVPGSYDELVASFVSGDIQLAWFGGLTFIRAAQAADADPLVMRDVDLQFTSDFLVASSASDQTIEELVGTRLGFGARLSTSGHLMPRYFLHQLGLEPERSFAEVRYSTGHDQTAQWVRDGEVDVAAVNSVVVRDMFDDGRLTHERVRVLWTTPPYRNYVWALQADTDPGIRARLLNAFLALEATVPEHAAVLAAQGAAGYVPASLADYADLERAAEMFAASLNDRPPA